MSSLHSFLASGAGLGLGAAADPVTSPVRNVDAGTLPEAVPFVDDPWVVAAVVVVIVWVGSGILVNRVRPQLEDRLRPSTANLGLVVARIAVVLYALVPFAGLLGFRPRNVLLSFTVLSLVLGAILAPVGRSYVSGLFILFNRPYEVGDVVELVEREERGYVDDITLGYTKLTTLDNSFLVVPNETMRERDVRNLSAVDERLRETISVCITYESDLTDACSILEDAARSVDGVITGGPSIRVGHTPFPAEPTTLLESFGDHGLHLVLAFWIDDPSLVAGIRSEVRRAIWDGVVDTDVDIAYPHTHVVFDQTSGRARIDLGTSDTIDSNGELWAGSASPRE
ncbi:mechanosensitive ion channel family protein [Natronosalvus vescus]|uniref:mechanosensitive ion channel family protein n=1 Tax=Natronosalvus vescus TaxID=2953881 RepID=UPI002091B999|nr:mechanosensitive ion channel domain-containing protein [Natronosalvus vescus]